MSNAVWDDKSHFSAASGKGAEKKADKPARELLGIALFTAVIVAALWYGYHDFMSSDQRLGLLNAQLEQAASNTKS